MEFQLKGGMGGMPQLPPNAVYLLLVPGFVLLGLGILLFFNEWLLRYLVAGVFVVLGGLLTMMGLRMKRLMG
ncbi:MAG: hypothetical protein AB7O97_19205 [Planctomycetota bacterium]